MSCAAQHYNLLPITYHLVGGLSADVKLFEECCFRLLHCTPMVVTLQMETTVDKKESEVSAWREVKACALAINLGYVEHDFTMSGVKGKGEYVRWVIFAAVGAIECPTARVTYQCYRKLVPATKYRILNCTQAARVDRAV